MRDPAWDLDCRSGARQLTENEDWPEQTAPKFVSAIALCVLVQHGVGQPHGATRRDNAKVIAWSM